MQLLKSLVEKLKAPMVQPDPMLSPEQHDKEHTPFQWIQENKCPFCLSKESLYEGPSGGMSVNCLCGQCGAKLNISPIHVDVLRDPLRITETITELREAPYPAVEVTQRRIDHIRDQVTCY